MPTGQSQVEGVALDLAFDARSAAVARASLRKWLREVGASRECAEDARVVVTELVSNCVRHARSLPGDLIRVSWERVRRGVLISVEDGGSTQHPHQVDAGPGAVSGRGLTIVDRLATEWWEEPTPGGAVVRALLPLE